MTRIQRDDRGVAMVVALLLVVVVLALTTAIYASTTGSLHSSAADRQRTTGVNAAEAGINTAYATIAAADPTALPCTASVGPSSSLPDTSTVAVTITYQLSDGTSQCPVTDTGATVTGALIVSKATTNQLSGQSAVSRTMQSLIRLTPVYAPGGLDKAIYTDGNLSLANNTVVTGNNGPDADIYTTKAFTCANNEYFDGSVYGQSTATLTNSCSIAKDLYTAGSITQSNNGTFGGSFKSSGGNISVSGNASITGDLEVTGSHTITMGGSSCGAPKCVTGKSFGPPPTVPFPSIFWDDTVKAAWGDAGYTNVVTFMNCTNPTSTSNAAVNWLTDDANSMPGKTLLVTDCQINLRNTKTIKLNNDLAIFSYGGFNSTNQVGFDSTSSTVHNLYWIVPNNVEGTETPVTRSCTSPGITTSNQFSLTDNIQMLLYSPCDINFANSSTHIGQLYSGSDTTINNRFRLQFRPLPVYGVTDVEPTVVSSYNVDVVYEREQ